MMNCFFIIILAL